MGFVKDLFGKEAQDVTIKDIQSLIKARKEEDRFLEYKSPEILRHPEELSQWVSAFLNAEGGLIIIGVAADELRSRRLGEQKVIPRRVMFVPPRFNAETVRQLIWGNIVSSSKPVINVYPVSETTRAARSIYLVEIPPGDNPPYQASDGRYYRRLNNTKYAMPHNEVAESFGRRKKPRLALLLELTNVTVEDTTYRFSVRFYVVNNGLGIGRYAQFAASFGNSEIESIDQGNVTRIDHVRGGMPSIQWESERALHPTGQRTQVAEITFKLQSRSEPFTVNYTLVAEDMDLIEDKYSLSASLLEQAKGMLERGRRPALIHPEAGES